MPSVMLRTRHGSDDPGTYDVRSFRLACVLLSEVASGSCTVRPSAAESCSCRKYRKLRLTAGTGFLTGDVLLHATIFLYLINQPLYLTITADLTCICFDCVQLQDRFNLGS